MKQFEFQDQVDDDEQRQVLSYWRDRSRDGALPSREDIDPLELRGLLPIVGLIDVERSNGRLRFRYRLIGTYMIEMFGDNFTGTYADESKVGAYGAYLHDLYSDAAEGGRAVYSVSRFGYRGKAGDVDRSYLGVKRLILPLSNGETVDKLLFSNKFYSLTDSPLKQPYRQDDLLDVLETSRVRDHISSSG